MEYRIHSKSNKLKKSQYKYEYIYNPIKAEELSVRRYVVMITLLSGPIATAVDIVSIIISLDDPNIRYGPALRVLSVLAILYVQRLIYKFIEVVPGVMHILIFIGGILFTLAIIGH